MLFSDEAILVGQAVDERRGDRFCTRALIKTTDLSADTRMAVHTTKCAFCGDQVNLDQAIPDGQGAPIHRHCWADAYGAPVWFLKVR